MVDVIEGGIATRLQPLHEPGSPPDLLNLANEGAVQRIHVDSASAGANVLLTNTFGSNPVRLKRDGHADQVWNLNLAAIATARRVADSFGSKVAASVGPTGEMWERYGGTLDPGACLDSYLVQARALAGADLFMVETMYDLDEARIAVRACTSVGVPTVVCFSFDSKGCRTMMGVTSHEAAGMAAEWGAVGVGLNCGAGLDMSVENGRVLAAVAQLYGLGFWFRPNCGIPTVTGQGTVWPEPPSTVAAACAEMVERGAVGVGACCGSTDAHVTEIAWTTTQIGGVPDG